MLGNWTLSKADYPPDRYPDFCSGFLYLTTPSVGAALVQVGLLLYPQTEVVIIEDNLITGILRERLSLPLETMKTGVSGKLWADYLSYCPQFVNFFYTFYNDFVISKRSSRGDVHYVGPITDLRVWRFFMCTHIEFVFCSVEEHFPGMVPDFLWNICVR